VISWVSAFMQSAWLRDADIATFLGSSYTDLQGSLCVLLVIVSVALLIMLHTALYCEGRKVHV
jgi:uncharacterized membrane protein (UPF0182 family)